VISLPEAAEQWSATCVKHTRNLSFLTPQKLVSAMWKSQNT
jgi:hypothetical protein